MENWIGIGIWIVMGSAIGLVVRALVSRPEETPGHVPVLLALSSFGAVIGGMLGVGIFHFYRPTALGLWAMVSAAVFAAFIAWVYRWGTRGWL